MLVQPSCASICHILGWPCGMKARGIGATCCKLRIGMNPRELSTMGIHVADCNIQDSLQDIYVGEISVTNYLD
jgi:hypothetical protein